MLVSEQVFICRHVFAYQQFFMCQHVLMCQQSERARKNSDNELGDAVQRISELMFQLSGLTTDRRRMESDLGAMHTDLDEALKARRDAEERADRIQMEVNRLVEELRVEQDNYRQADTVRRQMEAELRDIAMRLEQAENFAHREGKKLVVKLQARVISHFVIS